MTDVFRSFLSKVKGRLRRIANSLRSHLSAQDLEGDAWVAAVEIGEQRGREVDFDNSNDVELILNRVYWNVKAQNDWRLSAAHSINDDSEGATPWAEILAAADLSPEQTLIRRQADAEKALRLERSYSQAAAYYISIGNFRQGRMGLCEHLAISDRALSHRLAREEAIVEQQDSVFDGKARIDPSFIPMAGRPAVWRRRPTEQPLINEPLQLYIQ